MCSIAGGVESMTRAPLVMPKAREAFPRGEHLYDTTLGWRFVNPRMEALHGTHAMGETAEKVAEKHGISARRRTSSRSRASDGGRRRTPPGGSPTRSCPSRFRSARGRHARRRGRAPAAGDDRRRSRRAGARVPQENGTVTAGNSSGINDGAAAVLLASQPGSRESAGSPAARRFVASGVAGVDPAFMGLGPDARDAQGARARRHRRRRSDLFELNEAFAAQALPCLRELGLDPTRVNVNGGAIAIGHPLGASARAWSRRWCTSSPGAARATASPACASASARGSPPSSSAHERSAARSTRTIAAAVFGAAAHEIKNALGPLAMTLQLAERQLLAGQPIPPADMAFARAQVRRLSRLVEDLMDLTRADLDLLAVRPRAVDLAAVVNDTVDTFRRGHAAPGLGRAARRAPLPVVDRRHAHPPGAAQPARERRALFARRRADRRRGLVARRGRGARDRARSRARASPPPSSSGSSSASCAAPPPKGRAVSGIGLYLCRTIVERHGGAIGVDSTVGDGAAFWIDLPR